MKRAYTNGILLDGTEQMQPVEHKILLTEDDKIIAIVDEGVDLDGYEVIDLRMAGLTGRFRTAEVQMQRLHQGEIDEIETLACPKLRCLTNADGKFRGCYSWGECISACRI